jgi:hypothetical protein
MREIFLTQDKIALVDDEDFEYLNQWKWCANKGSNTFYAMRSGGIMMHRVLLNLSFGDKRVVDHIDRNGLNNQRKNIRVVTCSENYRNSEYWDSITIFA